MRTPKERRQQKRLIERMYREMAQRTGKSIEELKNTSGVTPYNEILTTGGVSIMSHRENDDTNLHWNVPMAISTLDHMATRFRSSVDSQLRATGYLTFSQEQKLDKDAMLGKLMEDTLQGVFLLELTFKTLFAIRNNAAPPRGHDHRELFEELDDDIQQAIIATSGYPDKDSLMRALPDKHYYTDLRYFFSESQNEDELFRKMMLLDPGFLAKMVWRCVRIAKDAWQETK